MFYRQAPAGPTEKALPALPPKDDSDDSGDAASTYAADGEESGPEQWPNEKSAADQTTFKNTGKGLDSEATVDDEGRINVSFALKHKLGDLPPDYARAVQEFGIDLERPLDAPRLNIVVFIVGSRGDVQPYLALALRLIERYHHRVRIATHAAFRDFVLEQRAVLEAHEATRGLGPNLEFADIGGDPKELMAYMVKNPGLLPGFSSLTNGDIGNKRKMIKRILRGCYSATFAPDDLTGQPFAADAIISNPPAFAHVHVAEALGVPLTMSFTMPWSPTTAFSHPLVAIKQSNAQRGLTNYLSFGMAEHLTWQGLSKVINRFRMSHLGLPEISWASGPSVLDRLKVPYLYCWSPALIPKPKDWMQNIDITGFMFLENKAYKPDADLQDFLEKGPPPIYIGFGSIVVDDPEGLTRTLLDAIKIAGVRALISAGWSGMGGVDIPSSVFVLGNVPHDWLFAEGRVSAVCIHGGAGTTAIALRNGLPTIVVPFFGDQPFWGAMIARTGAGPPPIPFKQLTVDVLAEAFDYVSSDRARKAAGKMGARIRNEEGADACSDAFHRHLPLLNMRCDLDPSRVAYWWSQKYALRLSGFAAQTLVQYKLLKWKNLRLHRATEYPTTRSIPDPISGGATASLEALTHMTEAVALMFIKPPQGLLKMITMIPKSIYFLTVPIAEGLDNVPRLYGTKHHMDVMRIRGTGTGFLAGGQSFVTGFYDGISGLVMEPIKGARNGGGVTGALLGFARSLPNAFLQPAAGMLHLVAHPARGIYIDSVRKRGLCPADTVLQDPRRQLSQRDFDQTLADEHERILDAFDEAKASVKLRKAALKRLAKEYFQRLEEEAEIQQVVQELGDADKQDDDQSDYLDQEQAGPSKTPSLLSPRMGSGPYQAPDYVQAASALLAETPDDRVALSLEAKERRLQATLNRLSIMRQSRRPSAETVEGKGKGKATDLSGASDE